jgi:hypothetical protein
MSIFYDILVSVRQADMKESTTMTQYTEGQTVKTVYGQRALIIGIEEGYAYELESGETFAKSTMYRVVIHSEYTFLHEDKVMGEWK